MEYNEKTGNVAVQVPGRSWIQTIQTERAGGNAVWLEATKTSEGWTIVNFEQIASWNPDKMFVIPWYTLDQRQVLASLRSDPRWSLLQAVKGNELYIFPSDIFGWDSAEPRWILGMTWLATKILPDRFADIDMKEEIYQFFGQMYAMGRTVVDTAIMPKVLLPGK
jgi:iron complex transport system substrate-binding protein